MLYFSFTKTSLLPFRTANSIVSFPLSPPLLFRFPVLSRNYCPERRKRHYPYTRHATNIVAKGPIPPSRLAFTGQAPPPIILDDGSIFSVVHQPKSVLINEDGAVLDDFPPLTRSENQRIWIQGPLQRLTSEKINEIRKLRRENPETWSLAALCKKFLCSPYEILRRAPDTRQQIQSFRNQELQRIVKMDGKKRQRYYLRLKQRQVFDEEYQEKLPVYV